MIQDDAELFARLRDLWRRRDPVPDGFVESMVAAVATYDVGAEYELFTMLESSDRLAGVRGVSEARTLQFSIGEVDAIVTMMLRISQLDAATDPVRSRIDGWIAPPAQHHVRMEVDHEHFATVSSGQGRFEFRSLPTGTATLWIEPATSGSHLPGRILATPAFEL